MRFGERAALPFTTINQEGQSTKLLLNAGESTLTTTDYTLTVFLGDGSREDLKYCEHILSSSLGKTHVMTYWRHEGGLRSFVWATSTDQLTWYVQGETMTINERGAIVANMPNENPILVFGQNKLKIAELADKEPIRVTPCNYKQTKNTFSEARKTPLLAQFDQKGIFILYDCSYRLDDSRAVLQLGCLLLDSQNPHQVIWQSEKPIFSENYRQQGKLIPLGAVIQRDLIYIYWEFLHRQLVITSIVNPLYHKRLHITPTVNLVRRHHKNPVLSPAMSWEAAGTFNPAALLIDGAVHLIYRAVGKDGISRFGYAASADGKKIDERLDKPAYIPRAEFEGVRGVPDPYHGTFQSGWGWGGCEDPKLTRIGDTIYMTYVAFDGATGPRSAITSISVENFLKNNWNWTQPCLISAPGVITKSVCLLDEKINNKYVLFHRVFPNILVDYLDDLTFDGENKWLSGKGLIPIRPRMWDSRKLSVGAPPIKTDYGWLTIYHAVDDRDDKKYKMGAMLADNDDPTKILWRTKYPMLSPDEWYENDWKPGIVYPSGAVVKDDELLIYYGGGDKTVCLAEANLEEFIFKLRQREHNVCHTSIQG